MMKLLLANRGVAMKVFYIDDKAIRPSEFASMTYDEIISLLEKEK